MMQQAHYMYGIVCSLSGFGNEKKKEIEKKSGKFAINKIVFLNVCLCVYFHFAGSE